MQDQPRDSDSSVRNSQRLSTKSFIDIIRLSQLDQESVSLLEGKSILTKINISMWISLAYVFAAEILFVTTVYFSAFELAMSLLNYLMIAYYNVTNLYVEYDDLMTIFKSKHAAIARAVIVLLIVNFGATFYYTGPPGAIAFANIGRMLMTYMSILCFAYKMKHIIRLMEEFKDCKLHRVDIEQFSSVYTYDEINAHGHRFKEKRSKFRKMSKHYALELYLAVSLVIIVVLVVVINFDLIMNGAETTYIVFTIVNLFTVLAATTAQIVYFNLNIDRTSNDYKVKTNVRVKFFGVIISKGLLYSVLGAFAIVLIKLSIETETGSTIGRRF